MSWLSRSPSEATSNASDTCNLIVNGFCDCAPHLFCARMTVDACARLSARWLDPVGWMLSSMFSARLTASDASFLRPLAWYKLAPSSRLRATVGDRDGSADACTCSGMTSAWRTQRNEFRGRAELYAFSAIRRILLAFDPEQ